MPNSNPRITPLTHTALSSALLLAGCAAATQLADPNAIELGGALTRDFVPANAAAELTARITLDASTIKSADRPPIEIALAIDSSGSMEGDAIANAKRAALALVDALSTGDRLAIVTFDSQARAILPITRVDPGTTPKIKAAIQTIIARGTTDMSSGLVKALDELTREPTPGAVRRIVLLSDGIPNDAKHFGGLADRAKSEGITITTLGLGLEYDETLLAALAQRSGGMFHFIESSTEVAKVFSEEIVRLHRVIARNAYLVVSPGPGVTIKDVPGSGLQSNGAGGYYLSLGEVTEGDQRDVVVAFDVKGRRDGANVELFDVVLSFDDAVSTAGHIEKRLFLGAKATADVAKIEASRHPEVERAAIRGKIAAATNAAIALARANRLEEAKQLLDQTESEARELAKTLDAPDLLTEAASLVALKAALPSYVAAANQPAAFMDEKSVYENQSVKKVHDRAMQMMQNRSYSTEAVTF